MRAWIIPAVALFIVGLGGLGAGWAINEWQDDEVSVVEVVATPVATPQPTPMGPSQAEIDAELCAAALAAAGEALSAPPNPNAPWPIAGPSVPIYIRNSIDRYCVPCDSPYCY